MTSPAQHGSAANGRNSRVIRLVAVIVVSGASYFGFAWLGYAFALPARTRAAHTCCWTWAIQARAWMPRRDLSFRARIGALWRRRPQRSADDVASDCNATTATDGYQQHHPYVPPPIAASGGVGRVRDQDARCQKREFIVGMLARCCHGRRWDEGVRDQVPS